MEEIHLLGACHVAPLDLAGAIARIAERPPGQPLAFVVSLNAQILILTTLPESGLGAPMAAAWLRLNDSRVVARLHRWATGQSVPLAAGSDITQHLLETAIQPDDPITIIGGGPELVPALVARFGLTCVAQHEPPMGYISQPEAREAAIRFAQSHPARFLFIATGAPRSEILMTEIQARGGVTGVGLCVGSGLLFAVGLTRRAPAWMRSAGLEWLHRAWTDPWRLGRRYASDLPALLRLAWRARRQSRAGHG